MISVLLGLLKKTVMLQTTNYRKSLVKLKGLLFRERRKKSSELRDLSSLVKRSQILNISKLSSFS